MGRDAPESCACLARWDLRAGIPSPGTKKGPMTQQPLSRTAPLPESTTVTQPDLYVLPDLSDSDEAASDTGVLAGPAPVTDVFDQEVATPDLVRLYLDEIGKAPLLDAATEVELAQRIEAGLYARHLLDRLGHRRAVKLREARKVASSVELTRLVDQGEVAKRAFIRANLRLVVSLARRYTRASMPLLDLIQEGNVGLVRAVEKFDYARGYKFSTYATWWIRQSIGRAIAEQSRTVRLPVHQVEKLSRLSRTRRDLSASLGRDATDAEVATEMGVDVDTVQDLDRISRTPASLDALVGEDGGTTLGDLVDASDATPEDLVVEADSRGELIGLVDRLTDRESEVIRCRYGLVPGPKQTYEEIAGRIGVSRERVRQIEREALERLRLWVADDPG
jgi:RNA polymerase primary sigma factor